MDAFFATTALDSFAPPPFVFQGEGPGVKEVGQGTHCH